MNKLATNVGTLGFDSPLILASGYITETPAFFRTAQPYGCSGMVTRSLKEVVPPERSKTPAPRYHIFDNGRSMLNCEWGNKHDWRLWLRWAEEVQSVGGRLIISLSGRDSEGCQNLLSAFSSAGCADAFEINVSCSHSGHLHGNLNVDTVHLTRLIGACRKRTNIPIWVKLSYSPVIADMAVVAEQSGADAIVCTNTVGPGLVIDTETSKPVLGIRGGAGGVSGSAIFPIAMWCVSTVSRAVSLPVVGVGGVDSADKAIQMMMAGASLVQLYTAPALQGPATFASITAGIGQFLATHSEYSGTSDLVGVSRHWIEEESHFDTRVPTLDTDLCVGCAKCNDSCAFGAVEVVHDTATISAENCVGCNACAGVCPTGAIKPVVR